MIDSPPVAQPQSPQRVRTPWTRWLLTAVLMGYFLVAHGCHAGDHDTELFTQFWIHLCR
ncbi:hypothetical protein [Tuwongella immobilis]|uniref:Uncharacterized protein n=1 Tax=Tuwongella immobilis TaxID=692036 RepID=A0A6C2YN66_9BACT|nr:hypothetical protein [Tuwongella immobilis]VIP02824.1 unnamed protein product [Tuwongella immobilis]VTS02560.1 unnamed protein product [Tuwongella immobilis]